MSLQAISRTTAEHYQWGEQCDGWHLLKTSELSVIEECMPPFTAETAHSHKKAQQFFFVLSGFASIDVEGTTFKLFPGDGLHVPPGRRHIVRNEGSEALRFLVISQPPSHGDRHYDGS